MYSSKKNTKILNSEYKRNLKLVEKILGNGITNGAQLNCLANKIFGKKFKGILDENEPLPKLKNMECVIRNRLNNEHWISEVNIGGKLYTYDSFNRKEYIDGKSGDFDGFPDQKKNEQNCGQRSLSYLITVYQNM